jgi:hypothetical protein
VVVFPAAGLVGDLHRALGCLGCGLWAVGCGLLAAGFSTGGDRDKGGTMGGDLGEEREFEFGSAHDRH